MSKLALGTAQFGSDYGIANQKGKIKLSEAQKIMNLAKKTSIELIDTAIDYGDSQSIMGNLGVKDFKIVTKLPDLPNSVVDIDSWVEDQVKSSLTLMDVSYCYGLLIHKSKDLLDKNGKKLINAINKIKINGLVEKIGISIYDPSELEQLMNLFKFDIVQAPLNIIDRRLEKSGWLSKLNKYGVEVHSRSAFLQGLLLMKRSQLPKKFLKWQNILDRWFLEIEKDNLKALEECLSYPLSLKEVKYVVVGVDSYYQFKDLLKVAEYRRSNNDWSFMISDDQMLINPYNWNKL